MLKNLLQFLAVWWPFCSSDFQKFKSITVEEQLMSIPSPLFLCRTMCSISQALTQDMIFHQILVVWTTALAPGTLPEMWPSLKNQTLNHIPPKNILGQVRHTHLHAELLIIEEILTFFSRWEFSFSSMRTRKTVNIWGRDKNQFSSIKCHPLLLISTKVTNFIP